MSTSDIHKQDNLLEDITNIQIYEKVITDVLKANYVSLNILIHQNAIGKNFYKLLIGANTNQNLLVFNQKIENRFQGINNQIAQQSKRKSVLIPESGNVSKISHPVVNKYHFQRDEIEFDLDSSRVPMPRTGTVATQKPISRLDLID
jgi:hypothetical protein